MFIYVKISKNEIFERKDGAQGFYSIYHCQMRILLNFTGPASFCFTNWFSFGRSTPLFLVKENQYCPTDFCEIVSLQAKHEPGPSLALKLMEERCVQMT